MALPLPTSLSPSKVSTFKDCALAFRFSAIDKLPEPPSIPAVKGTTVHRALELLFGAEPADRTPELAQECLSEALLEMRSVEEYLGLRARRRCRGQPSPRMRRHGRALLRPGGPPHASARSGSR